MQHRPPNKGSVQGVAEPGGLGQGARAPPVKNVGGLRNPL